MLYRDLQIPVRWDRVTASRKKQKMSAKEALVLRGQPVHQSAGTVRDRKQQRRSARRTASATATRQVGGSRLRAAYVQHWTDFLSSCRAHQLPVAREADMDASLVQYLDMLYDAGEDLAVGNYVKASVLFHRPELKKKNSLNRAQQALKGWRVLNPPRSRMPIPFEVVALLAMKAASESKWEIGLCLLMSFMLYLRPGEFEKIRVCDIVRPVKRGGPLYKQWSIVLHPYEEGIPSKTAQWDEAVSIDLEYQQFLGPALDKHLKLRGRPPLDKAFSVTMAQVNAFMETQ